MRVMSIFCRIYLAIIHRYNRELPTIFTTNAELGSDRVEERIASRLVEGTVVTLRGPDRRLRAA